MASAVGTQTLDTGAAASVSGMEMAQKDAVSLTDLYTQVMNDAKQLQSSGQSGYAPNTAIAHDVNNAVRAGQQMQYDYFTPLNQMNASAHQFVNAATDQLQMMQLGAESGRLDLSGMRTLAQNVTEALSPLVPQAAPAAPAAAAASLPGASAGAAPSLNAATPAMAKVTSDLASEASATTTADKASFNSAAIKDLLAAVGSPASPAPADAAPLAATPVTASSAAPAQSPAMSQQLGTDLLQSLGQLTDVANQSGAPASTQDAIAKLIGLIQNMFRGASSPVGAPAKPAAAQAAAPAPAQHAPCQPAAAPQAAAPQPASPDTNGLVAILQQLQGILDQLKPYLANSPKGNAAMDSVAKVVGEIAKALQGSAKTAVA